MLLLSVVFHLLSTLPHCFLNYYFCASVRKGFHFVTYCKSEANLKSIHKKILTIKRKSIVFNETVSEN